MTLLHAPAAPALSPRSAAAVFPPRPQSRSPSPPRRPPSPPARRPSPPPLSLGPSAVGLGGPPALRSLALPLPRGRDDSAPRSPSRSPLGRDAPRAPLPWGHPADVTACWPNHGPVTASCDSPPPGGAHLPCGGDDLVAALLQGTVEALLFGGSIADSDSARSSASAAGRVPDAFWPPEMTAEASPPAVVMHARADSPAMPPAVAEHAPPQHLRSSEPEQLASVVTWRVAEDTPSPDGSASGSDAGAEAEAEEAADPVVAALLARIAACRAELRCEFAGLSDAHAPGADANACAERSSRRRGEARLARALCVKMRDGWRAPPRRADGFDGVVSDTALRKVRARRAAYQSNSTKRQSGVLPQGVMQVPPGGA
jgi:hypothetical protein